MSSSPTETAKPNRLAPQPGVSPARRSLDKGDVPSALLDRYLIERDRQGRPERYYRDHKTADPAFRDHGRALSSGAAYPDTVAAMLRIAQHRQWSRIKVSGDEAFRREVWIQGRTMGLDVAGYRPRERDRQAADEGFDRAPLRDPALRPRTASSPETLKRRLEMAAVVVRTLITDPVAQARLFDKAWAKVRQETKQVPGRISQADRQADRQRDR